jgi:hypothetical protein
LKWELFHLRTELTDKKIKHMADGNQKWPKLNTLETKMAKISHIKIKQPFFGENRTKLTYTKISQFMVVGAVVVIIIW